MWTTIPGVPGGRIEIRPSRPHHKDTAWNYTIVAPPAQTILGTGLVGLTNTQHAMLYRVPDLMQGRPWVVARITVADDLAWKAILALGPHSKTLAGGPGRDRDESLLLAAKAIFESLKRPVKLVVYEPTGRLRTLYDEGYHRGQGHGSLMEEVSQLSSEHYVRVLVGEKREAPLATSGASNRTMS